MRNSGEGVFPVVLIKVDGITTRTVIDTGGSSSYVSANVADMLSKKPSEIATKRVEMLMCSHIAKSETYDAGRIANRGGVFTVPTLTTKLLSVPRASPHASFVIEGITPRYATNHLIEKTGKSQ